MPASSREELALAMLYGDVDAVTGEPLPYYERSPDALLCADGHNVNNIVVTTIHHNRWKGVRSYAFSKAALTEWLDGSTDGKAVRAGLGSGATLEQCIAELLRRDICAFFKGVLTVAMALKSSGDDATREFWADFDLGGLDIHSIGEY